MMFQRQAQTPSDQVAAHAADYRAASQKQAEVQQDITRLLAHPLSLKEQQAIMGRVLERSRQRFDAEMDRRFALMGAVDFDPSDPKQLDALDPTRILGEHPHKAYSDAVNTFLADRILAELERRATETGAAKSKLTVAKRQEELARLEAIRDDLARAAGQALNQWRALTGNLEGYP